MCPVQETPSVSCWTSARSRWFSTWTGTSCRQRNRSSPQPRKKNPADTHTPILVPVEFFRCGSPASLFLTASHSAAAPGPVSLRRPASCHTSSASSTLGPSLSVTRHLSNLAPSMTSLHSSPVKKSFCPGKPCLALVLTVYRVHLFTRSNQCAGFQQHEHDSSLEANRIFCRTLIVCHQ